MRELKLTKSFLFFMLQRPAFFSVIWVSFVLQKLKRNHTAPLLWERAVFGLCPFSVLSYRSELTNLLPYTAKAIECLATLPFLKRGNHAIFNLTLQPSASIPRGMYWKERPPSVPDWLGMNPHIGPCLF